MVEPESKAKMVKGNLKEGGKTFHPILVTQKQKKNQQLRHVVTMKTYAFL